MNGAHPASVVPEGFRFGSMFRGPCAVVRVKPSKVYVSDTIATKKGGVRARLNISTGLAGPGCGLSGHTRSYVMVT